MIIAKKAIAYQHSSKLLICMYKLKPAPYILSFQFFAAGYLVI